MHYWFHEQVQEQRYRDMLRDAERQQLIGTLNVERRRERVHHRLLVELGRGLRFWGTRSRPRSGRPAEVLS